MINFTDINPTLFASDGQFFYGKLVFLSPGTTDPKQVFDKDGVVYASNVVTTDTKGRMAIQVFLDGAYDVQFWKFVGTQFDIDDPTQWALDREVRILDPSKVELKISGDAIVGTIEDLRDVDNAAEGATMTVMGYYAAGDMTPQYYYWNPDAADPDDGGSVICPEGRTGKGRWLMIPQRVVDVRAFGVKPSQQTETATVTGNMAAAFNFANRYNRDLWFPKGYSSNLYSSRAFSFYKFNGGNFELPYERLLIDANARLVADVGATVIRVQDVDSYGRIFGSNGSGTFTLYSDTVRLSWDGPNVTLVPRKKVFADNYPVNNIALEGLTVVQSFYDVENYDKISVTGCVIVDAANGNLVGQKRLSTKNFYLEESRPQTSYILKMICGDIEYFRLIDGFSGNTFAFSFLEAVRHAKKDKFESGFFIDENNEWSSNGLIASFINAQHIVCNDIDGVLTGSFIPSANHSRIQINLTNDSTDDDKEIVAASLTLREGEVGFVVVVYQTAGGYVTGYIPVSDGSRIIRKIKLSLVAFTGGSSPSVHLSVNQGHFLMTVIRLPNEIVISTQKRWRIPRSDNDYDMNAWLSTSIENV